MKKAIFSVIMSAIAFAAMSAPVPQASQAWVQTKIDKLRVELLSYLSSSQTNGISEAQVIENAVSTGIAEMQGIADLGAAISQACVIDNPYYVISIASPQYTNSIPVDSKLYYATTGTYTNSYGATLVESGATNVLSFSTYSLYCQTNSNVYVPDSGNGYAMIVKIAR